MESWILMTCLSVSLALYALNAVLYPTFLESHFSLPIATISVVIAFIVMLTVRLKRNVRIPLHLQETTLYIGVIVACMFLVGTFADKLLYANFFFSHVHIHPVALEAPAIFLFLATILLCPPSFLVKKMKTVLVLFPLWSIPLLYIFSLHFADFFWEMEREDSLSEWLTFFAYITSAYFSLRIFELTRHTKQWKGFFRYFIMCTYIVATLGFVVIAGEEISWGQRIFGFSTPEEISRTNTQHEFNFHNNIIVFHFVYLAYAVLCIYCAFAWFITSLYPPFFIRPVFRQFISFFIPPAYCMNFFLPMLAYVYLRYHFGPTSVSIWEEYCELVLSIGIAVFLVGNHHKASEGSLISLA